MERDALPYLARIFGNLAANQKQIPLTLEFELFVALRQKQEGASVPELLSKIDLETVIKDALARMESHSIIKKQKDKYFLNVGAARKQVADRSTADQTEADETPQPVQVDPGMDPFVPESDKNIEDRRERLRQEAFSDLNLQDHQEVKDPDEDLESLFDDELGLSMREYMTKISDISITDLTTAGEEVIRSLVDILDEHDYLENVSDPKSADAYQLIKLLVEDSPITLGEIEANLNVDSLSLLLYNLESDGLIEEMDLGHYALTNKVLDKLESSS